MRNRRIARLTLDLRYIGVARSQQEYQMLSNSSIFYAHFVTLMLLGGCNDGNSGIDPPPENDAEECSSTLNTSTSPGVEVDINGNVTPISTPTSTVSDCESSSGSDGTVELTAGLITRFISSDDYAVWDCTRADGSSLHYALPRRVALPGAPRHKQYGFEIDPSAADPSGSQQLYAWGASASTTGVSSTIKLWTLDKMGGVSLSGIQSEWTNITFATADTISVNSSTQGPMQCNRSIGVIGLAASRFDMPCRHRGPSTACGG
jgi:hypothetical protein